MSRAEILGTRLGEMFDMLACRAIANGEEPRENRVLSYDDAMKVR